MHSGSGHLHKLLFEGNYQTIVKHTEIFHTDLQHIGFVAIIFHGFQNWTAVNFAVNLGLIDLTKYMALQRP